MCAEFARQRSALDHDSTLPSKGLAGGALAAEAEQHSNLTLKLVYFETVKLMRIAAHECLNIIGKIILWVNYII